MYVLFIFYIDIPYMHAIVNEMLHYSNANETIRFLASNQIFCIFAMLNTTYLIYIYLFINKLQLIFRFICKFALYISLWCLKYL